MARFLVLCAALSVSFAAAVPAAIAPFLRTGSLSIHAKQAVKDALSAVAEIQEMAARVSEAPLVSSTTEVSSTRRSSPTAAQTAMCTEFNNDFDGILFDASNVAGSYQAVYAAGCSLNDVAGLLSQTDPALFSKACATSGVASATSCGADGFYAKAHNLGAKFNGMLHSSCQATITINGAPISMGSASTYLDLFAQITAMSCVSHDNQYCWPSFYGVISDVGANGPSADQLTQMCTPCTTKLVDAMFIAMGGSDVTTMKSMTKSIELMCAKVGSTFCYPAFMNVLGESATATAQQQAAFVCEDQCAQIVLTRTIEMMKIENEDASMLEGQFTSYCYKNADKYCYEFLHVSSGPPPLWANMVPTTSCGVPANGPDTVPMPANPTTCAGTCNADMQAINAEWGCCFTTLRDSTPQSFQNWLNAQETACSLTAPAACVEPSGATAVSATVCMANLAYTYHEANTADVQSKFKADVAMSIGVAPKLCSVTGASQITGNSGTCITISCTPATEVQSGNIAALLNSYQASRRSSSQLMLGQTSTLPADSRIDVNAGVSGQTTSAATCASGTCPVDNLAQSGGGVGSASSSSSSNVGLIVGIAVGAVVVIAVVAFAAWYAMGRKGEAQPTGQVKTVDSVGVAL